MRYLLCNSYQLLGLKQDVGQSSACIGPSQSPHIRRASGLAHAFGDAGDEGTEIHSGRMAKERWRMFLEPRPQFFL